MVLRSPMDVVAAENHCPKIFQKRPRIDSFSPTPAPYSFLYQSIRNLAHKFDRTQASQVRRHTAASGSLKTLESQVDQLKQSVSDNQSAQNIANVQRSLQQSIEQSIERYIDTKFKQYIEEYIDTKFTHQHDLLNLHLDKEFKKIGEEIDKVSALSAPSKPSPDSLRIKESISSLKKSVQVLEASVKMLEETDLTTASLPFKKLQDSVAGLQPLGDVPARLKECEERYNKLSCSLEELQGSDGKNQEQLRELSGRLDSVEVQAQSKASAGESPALEGLRQDFLAYKANQDASRIALGKRYDDDSDELSTFILNQRRAVHDIETRHHTFVTNIRTEFGELQKTVDRLKDLQKTGDRLEDENVTFLLSD